jgi:hypothetical protein
MHSRVVLLLASRAKSRRVGVQAPHLVGRLRAGVEFLCAQPDIAGVSVGGPGEDHHRADLKAKGFDGGGRLGVPTSLAGARLMRGKEASSISTSRVQ